MNNYDRDYNGYAKIQPEDMLTLDDLEDEDTGLTVAQLKHDLWMANDYLDKAHKRITTLESERVGLIEHLARLNLLLDMQQEEHEAQLGDKNYGHA